MKTAIVTGASSGLGMEFARHMAMHYRGLDEIWIVARRGELLQELKKELWEKYQKKARIFALDLMEAGERNCLKEALEEEKPEVRFLINSAGYGKIGSFTELGMEEQLGMVRLNCEALTAVTYLVLPYMPRNSRIIQVSSAAAYVPQPGFAVYAASKSYVLSFSLALNEELRSRDITVTAVCPGPVKTDFFRVAETKKKRNAYKTLFLSQPESIVRRAVCQSAAGISECACGKAMILVKILTTLFPTHLILWVMTKLNREEK